MHTHETQSAGSQPHSISLAANPLVSRHSAVAEPEQEHVASPTNPFPRRPHEVWSAEPIAPRTNPFPRRPHEVWSAEPSPAASSTPGIQTQAEPSEREAEINWKEISLYASGQAPPDPPQWNRGVTRKIQRSPVIPEPHWYQEPLVQAKLTVGQPNDAYEQEADRVAAQVMSMAPPATPNIHRQAETEESEEIQPKPLLETITPLVQRQDVNLPPVPNYQLTPPSLLTHPSASAPYQLGGPYPFRLNRQMQITALQYTQQQLTPATLTPLLSQLSLDALALTPPVGAAGPAPSPTTPPAAAPAPTPAPPSPSPATADAQPEALRTATPGDLLRAVLTMPTIATAITSLQSQTEQRLRSDWNRLRVGEQVGVVSSLAVVGSGAIAGIISSPDARQLVLSQLNGRVLPVPGINWLRVEINTGPDSLMMGLHLDVGALLPSIFGFGPGSSSAIGGPPQPQPFVPGVQRAAISAAAAPPQHDLENRLSQSQGGGSPLPDEVRSFMEPRFGADFSQVRVHTGGDAVQMNKELSAQAFTHKQNVYFGAGKSPGDNDLTAHELTHVVQQTQPQVRLSVAKSDAIVQRKQENEAPLAAIQGLAMYDLLPKLKGLPDNVRNDEQAALAVSGPRLVTAIHAVQSQIKGMLWYDYTANYNSELSALPVDQIVDIIKFFGDKNLPAYLGGALNHWNDAQTAKQQAPGKTPPGGRWAPGTIPAELLIGTRTPTPAERDKIRDALQPIATVGGAIPDFQPKTAKGNYEIRIRLQVQKWIDDLYKDIVVGRGRKEHNDPKNLHPMNRFEEIASAAKQEVDTVFGSYASGPAFIGGVNLFDAWAKNDAEIFGKPDATGKLVGGENAAAKFEQAKALVQYMFGADKGIRDINTEHNAFPSRTTPPKKGGDPESKILERVATTFAKTHGKKLIEIDRAWPGTAGGGKVNIQMWKAPTDDGNRGIFWNAFQTMIHEYLHTLAHPDYNNYVNSFAYGTPQQNTLDEGVDSLLTETAWSNVVLRAASPALRKIVEGPTYAALPFNPALVPSIRTQRYPSYAQAKAVVDVTGIQNLYAAYFLGKVDLIRASPPP